MEVFSIYDISEDVIFQNILYLFMQNGVYFHLNHLNVEVLQLYCFWKPRKTEGKNCV